MKKPIIVLACFLIAISSSAQVGIGTTTPNSTLDVQGSLAAKTTISTSTNYALASEHIFIYTGNDAATVTLPDASTITGRMYTIKNGSASGTTPPLTVNTTSTQTIDGITSQILSSAYQTMTVVSNGTNWNIVGYGLPGGSSTDWSLNGNTVSGEYTLGTKLGSAYALPFITNGIERMRITSTGNVGIGSSNFSDPAEMLLVDADTYETNNLITGIGTINGYLQFNIQNLSNGTSASSDIVATANNGSSDPDNSTVYVDLGINSQGYSNGASNILNGSNTAYLYANANDLKIGNGTPGKSLVLFTNPSSGTLGVNTANGLPRVTITGAGNMGVGNTSPNSTLSVGGSITVNYAATNNNYTISATDYVVLNTGNPIATWTLPDPAGCAGRVYKLINHGGNTVTLSRSVTTGNGSTTATLSNAAGSNAMEIISDGSVWHSIK
jgi:hypothetical protein